MNRRWWVLAGQLILVLSLWGKFAWDREHLPRAVVIAKVIDPEHPFRGRYLRMNVYPRVEGSLAGRAHLRADGQGQLVAEPSPRDEGVGIIWEPDGKMRVQDSVSLYVPDSVHPQPGTVKLEVSVTSSGRLRPIRILEYQ